MPSKEAIEEFCRETKNKFYAGHGYTLIGSMGGHFRPYDTADMVEDLTKWLEEVCRIRAGTDSKGDGHADHN